MFKISFKVHSKNDNRFCAVQASQQVNELVSESGESPSCSVYFYVKSPGVVLIFFKISLFLLHHFVLYSSFKKLNAGSILKVKCYVAKIGRHLGCYQQMDLYK